MGNIDLTRYGITGTKEIVYNPSYADQVWHHRHQGNRVQSLL